MNSDVIAIDVVRRMFLDCRIEPESDAVFEFFEKALGGPAVTQEEKLHTRALAVFTENFGVTEDLGDALDHRQNLIPLNESIETRAEIRIGRKPAAHAQRKADFGLAVKSPSDCSKSDVV